MPASGAPPAGDQLFLSGITALLYGIVQHRKSDELRGFNTESFVSGYRGSPLGYLDMEFRKQQSLLDQHNINFKEGLNEDLAATACWGTQQVSIMPKPRCEGVSAFWYGKGPGVDRSIDAIKHGNLSGTSPRGGVVLLVGDDHGAKSSSTAHQSEYALVSAGVPIWNPATVQEYVTLLPMAVELSRQAGVWVGFKCITETVESSGSVDLGVDLNAAGAPGTTAPPANGYHIKFAFAPLEQEKSLYERRLPAARRFMEAQRLDRLIEDADRRSLGIVAPGKSYVDVMEAFRVLGVDREARKRLGIRIFKPLMTWPLTGRDIREFCRNHTEVLVIEEKRGLVEGQLHQVLQSLDAGERPVVTGKHTPEGEALLPEYGELNALSVARTVSSRLQALGLSDNSHMTDPEAIYRRIAAREERQRQNLTATRHPMYCSGCPHNRSTRHPEDSIAFGGIGCHGIALWIPELHTQGTTHMGAEGANWIGIEPFTEHEHIFQNIGDGTYSHSGSLAIRAAIANGSNITYKVLYNSASAMTGGQPVEGHLSAADYARQLLAEGCTRVALVSEAPERYRRELLSGIELCPRNELGRVQEEYQKTRGVTAIIYDQGCAAERRRLRKRGEYPDPALRMLINPEVCEGCGDCNEKSSCVSVLPLETVQGRKRTIDQAGCNKDFTCEEGFCPSFVTVAGGRLKNRLDDPVFDSFLENIPEPQECGLAGVYNLLVAGIGGSGVISMGNSLAQAAMLEGKAAQTFDVTGLAQKNGPVYSHVRITNGREGEPYSPRIPDEQLDLLLGCDLVCACSGETLRLTRTGRSRAVINQAPTPTAPFQHDPDMTFDLSSFREALTTSLEQQHIHYIEASEQARALLGSDILMNVFVLGYACQSGLVPLTAESLLTVLSRRGNENRLAFQLGRLAAYEPAGLQARLSSFERPASLDDRPLTEITGYCSKVLMEYQNRDYAVDYEKFVADVERYDHGRELARAVAANLFRLMRYKDEYEVARLHSSAEFREYVEAVFEGDYVLRFHLAPPVLSFLKDRNGEPRKISFGPWMMTLFRILASLRWLRGTPFDPFGYMKDRRLERRLIQVYKEEILELLPGLTQENYDSIVEIARWPEQVRGYGHVKLRNLERARAGSSALRAGLQSV